MTHLFFRGALFLFVVLAIVPVAKADWINLTGAETAPNIAEIYVLEDHVKLVLEVYIGDLELFDALVPNDWMTDKASAADRPSPEARLRAFAQQTFRVVTGEGEQLPARLERVEPRMRVDRKSPFAGMINPITRQRVPEAPADKRVLYAEISYPFEGRPAELTFIPPQDEEGRARVSIGFIAYHKSVPVIDFRYLGAPARLQLDWEDPWYSRFENPNLKRHHKDALMSFLYVEPYEVRHEILVRVRDMANWMGLGLRGDEYIEVDELEPLKQRIGEFLLTKNTVLVDGKVLKPILDRSSYVTVSLNGIRLVEVPERTEIPTAIIGVIITYLTDGLPQQVTVDWELFTDQIERVPATATDPAGPLPTHLTPDDRVHTWTNYLKNYELPTVQSVAVAGSLGKISLPWGSLVAAVLLLPAAFWLMRRRRQGASLAAPLITVVVVITAGAVAYPFTRVDIERPAVMASELGPERSRALLQVLLKNVYRAFDFRDEEDVYDKLAVSVRGELLSDIYLQNRRAFAVRQAGGAQAKIKSVEIQEAVAERLDNGRLAYAIKGHWTAQGTVGHWGHIHMRKNQYAAIVTVEADNGAWKIADLEVLEEQRIDPAATDSGAVTAAKVRQGPGDR